MNCEKAMQEGEISKLISKAREGCNMAADLKERLGRQRDKIFGPQGEKPCEGKLAPPPAGDIAVLKQELDAILYILNGALVNLSDLEKL